jgi:5-methylthioadenosine/S-adenosylhomocysteine deaminase
MKILIKNGYVVTVDPKDAVFADGCVIIHNDKIEWVGPREELPWPESSFDEIVDAGGNLVIPGLINSHTHNVYYLMRGLGMDRDLKDWLSEAIWPCLKAINPEEAYIGSMLGCMENICSGTTYIIDNYYMAADKKENIDSVLGAIKDSGIKAVMARGYHDVPFNIPHEFLEKEGEVIAEYKRLLDKWHGADNGRIQIWVSPVNLLYCSPSSVQKVWELAKSYGVGLHTHVAEAKFEVEEIQRRHGKTYIEVFAELGAMGEKFHSVHSVFLSRKEMEILARHGATVMFNPASNMLLASGVAPIEEMLEAGVRVALGTDAPNNNQDMLESMKYAALLPRVSRNNPTAVTSYQALKMATIEGARAIGLDAEIGSLDPGKKADLVIVNMKKLHNTPCYDPVATLVYSSNQSDISTVFINGVKVLEEGKFVKLNEADVIAAAQETGWALYARVKNSNCR